MNANSFTLSRPVPALVAAFLFALISVPPVSGQDPAASASAFEVPPVLNASAILPPELLKSPLHQVAEQVPTYGYANTYRLQSAYADQTVRTTAMLRVRVQEIRALAAIAEIKKSKVFVDALANAAKSPLVGVKHLIENPVDTVAGIPRGAWRVLGRVGEGLSGKKKKGEFEDGTVKSMLGFSKVKRELALALKVDPYTSNKQLQTELNSLAWAGFAGKMGVSAALAAGGGAAVTAVQGLKATEDFAELIRDSNPIDLQRANRKKLIAMGVGEATYTRFLDNQWYSPTLETGLVHSLERLGGTRGRDIFVLMASGAASEDDAFYYAQTARLIASYHTRVKQVAGILDFYGMPICHAADRTLVAPLFWDHAAWTERGANAVQALKTFPVGGAPAPNHHLYISGTLSERARKELATRGFSVTENASLRSR